MLCSSLSNCDTLSCVCLLSRNIVAPNVRLHAGKWLSVSECLDGLQQLCVKWTEVFESLNPALVLLLCLGQIY